MILPIADKVKLFFVSFFFRGPGDQEGAWFTVSASGMVSSLGVVSTGDMGGMSSLVPAPRSLNRRAADRTRAAVHVDRGREERFARNEHHRELRGLVELPMRRPPLLSE